MRQPTFAPAYVALYPVLTEIAIEHGYTLCVHGSVRSDFDLVAVPWTDRAIPADKLIRRLLEYLNYLVESPIPIEKMFEHPFMEHKPHGRIAWCIPIGSGASLDISVTPLQTCPTPSSPA